MCTFSYRNKYPDGLNFELWQYNSDNIFDNNSGGIDSVAFRELSQLVSDDLSMINSRDPLFDDSNSLTKFNLDTVCLNKSSVCLNKSSIRNTLSIYDFVDEFPSSSVTIDNQANEASCSSDLNSKYRLFRGCSLLSGE